MKTIYEVLASEHRSEHKSEHNMKYIKAKIFHGGDSFDLKKRWYVYFSYVHPETGKMTRQKNIYLEVNKLKTKKERMNKLISIRDRLNNLLKQGYSPYKTDKEDSDIYSIKESLLWALRQKENLVTESTWGDYKAKTSVFIRFLEKHFYASIPAQDFTKRQALEFLNEIKKKNSAKTYNNYRTILSSLFALLKENEYVNANIISDIKPLQAKAKRNKSYSQKQLDEIFTYIKEKDEKLFFFIQFVSYNFLRPVEVVRLRWKDLKLDETPPYLEVRAKNKLEKTKIIPEILLREIEKQQKGNPDDFIFSTNDKGIETTEMNRRDFFSKQFGKVKKELGLGKDYTMYSFRHTFITKLYREFRKTRTELETYDILMKVTGHTTLKALKAYLRDIDAELAEDYSSFLE